MLPFTIRIDLIDDSFSESDLRKMTSDSTFSIIKQEQLRGRVQTFIEKYSKYIVAYEEASQTGKLHYQGIVWVEDDVAYKAMKTRFQTMFPHHKGSRKSMTAVKKATYESYIVKDGRIIFKKGYTDEEIEAFKAASYKKDEELVSKKVSKKSKPPSNFQNAYNFCIENGITIKSAGDGWEICDTLQHYYTTLCKCEPTDYQLQNMTKSIAKQLVYEWSQKHNQKHVYERFLRDRSRQILGSSWTAPVISESVYKRAERQETDLRDDE